MCGIMGYVGPQQAAPILLDGLRRLEYRGYDSAGVAVMDDGQAGLVASVTKRGDRGKSNAAQAALDVVDGVLGTTPAGTATRRYTKDARSDARELRESQTVISVAPGTRFKVQFTKSL